MQSTADGRRGRLPRKPLTDAHKDRLESIKSIAAELFYQAGYSATDLRRIADQAGMHVASLYNYVSGKEDLLFQIMTDGVVEINASLDEALAGYSDPLDRLRRSLISHIEHHAHRRHLGAVSHTEVRSLTGSRRVKMIKMRRDYEARWDDLVLDGMKAGLIPPGEPRVMVYALLSVGQSVSRWYDPSGKIPVSELAEELANMLLFGLLNRPSFAANGSRGVVPLSARAHLTHKASRHRADSAFCQAADRANGTGR
jgi:TetR/AcrR family transcriptional regulator, cholesterol catabolism regulator